jgi:protease IV
MQENSNGSSGNNTISGGSHHTCQTPPPMPVYIPAHSPAGRRFPVISRVIQFFFASAFIFSVILNLYMAAIIGTGMREQIYTPGNNLQKIALIDLAGTINMDVAEDMRRMLAKAADDDKVKGVILVANSPGGYVPPADLMNKYVRDFKEQTGKTVYVAVQEVCASGGYWIAVAGDRIYAQTNSIVGSIGVISMNFIVENTLKEKLGVEPVVIKSSRSPFKDRNSPFRMPTEEEKLEIIKDIDTIHQRFVEVVSKGRDIPAEQVWLLATGEVFDGPESVENKLIDKVGFLSDAIDDMSQELGLENPTIVRLMNPPTIKDMLTAGSKSFTANSVLDIQNQLEKMVSTSRIQALWLGR